MAMTSTDELAAARHTGEPSTKDDPTDVRA
jgi:hypothetical protein